MPLNLRANLPVDDNDPNIAYSAGDWQQQTGSTRQYNAGVHLTNNFGATVSFRYSGQAFALIGTTPPGGGNVVVDISINGGSPTTVSIPCDQTAQQYSVDFFESPITAFAVHTVVITNRGRSSDPSFMFDVVRLYSDDINPSMASPPTLAPTTTSTTPRETPTPTTPTPTTTPQTSSTTHTTQGGGSISTSSTSSAITHTESSTSTISTGTAAGVVNGTSPHTFISTTSYSTKTTTFLSTDARGSTVMFTQTLTTSLAAAQTDAVITAAAGKNPPNIGAILAGVFGGLAFLLLLVVACLFVRRRRNSQRQAHAQLEEDERLVLRKPRTGRALTMPQPFPLIAGPHPTSSQDDSPTVTSGMGGQVMLEKTAHRTQLQDRSSFEEGGEGSSSSGPSFTDQFVAQAPRGFSSAAQPDPTANNLSHRRSTSMARPPSPTMSSMYMSSSSSAGGTGTGTMMMMEEAPPAYQPPLSGNRVSDFKTRSQLHSPGGGDSES